MKCYVINLDRSKERLAGIVEMFRVAGVPFERFPAVDGDLLTREHLAAVTKPRHDYRPLTAAEVGCVLSHRGCWELIAAGSDQFATVFEDDIDLSPTAYECLRDLTWVPEDADLVKLEAYWQKIWVGRRRLKGPVDHSVSRLHSTHWGTAGYIVNRAFAVRLLEVTTRFSATADDLLFNPRFAALRDSNVYQINPAICVQRQYKYDLVEGDPYLSTVPSRAPGPETAVSRSRLMREVHRFAKKTAHRLRLQVPIKVSYHQAGDS